MGLGPEERDNYPPRESDWLMLAGSFSVFAVLAVLALAIWLNMF